jgi:hypothetical protein
MNTNLRWHNPPTGTATDIILICLLNLLDAQRDLLDDALSLGEDRLVGRILQQLRETCGVIDLVAAEKKSNIH